MRRGFAEAVNATRTTLVVAFFASVVAATLSLTSSVGAQESTAEQNTTLTQGTTTIEAETETTDVQPPDADNEGKRNDPAAKPAEKPSDNSRQRETLQLDEDQGDVKAAQTGPLSDASVQITDTDSDNEVNRIVAAASNCNVDQNATITIEDRGGAQATFRSGSESDGYRITALEESLVIQGLREDGNIAGGDFGGSTFGPDDGADSETGTVVRATGISCDRANGSRPVKDPDDNREIFDDENDNGNDDFGTLELDELECEELLRRFRTLEQNQYGDRAAFAAADVQERIIVCLEREVVDGTAADEDLPKTGGLPLLGLAALGLASVVVGASVIRGVRRGE